MSTVPVVCPLCEGSARMLPVASRRKPFAYYLCRWCGHTWMEAKASVNRPVSPKTSEATSVLHRQDQD